MIQLNGNFSRQNSYMMDRAWQLLVDEIAVVRGTTKETVEGQLVRALNKSNLKAPLPS